MTDCLIIGHNDGNFRDFVEMLRSMGEESGAYRDLRLAFANIDGIPMHALDVMTKYAGQTPWNTPYHNTDFLWPTIAYLGTYLHRRGHTFDYINRFQLEKESLKEKLRGDVRAVAITTTLHVSVHPILEIIDFIRQHNDRVKIIVGGPYVGNLPSSTDRVGMTQLFEYMDADFFVIQSEGEQALVQILNCLKQGGDPATIPNIAYKTDGGYELTGREVESNPLDQNMVDYSLFPAEDYGQFVTLRTAKSCPFSCSFCGFPERAGKYTYLTVESVEQELDAIRAIGGVTTLTFIDDTFNVPKKRFQDIMRMMIRKEYGFRWNIFYRSDHGDPETIELMAASGCEGVFLGIESGSDTMLKLMNKTSRRAHYLDAIPRLRRAGISTHASLIIGFPGETAATVQETITLLNESPPDFFRAQLWYCDPVTPIWKRRTELGIEGSAFNWSHHTMAAAEACAIVDELFRARRESVWLPQNGFEMWSLFYLQRLGMSLAQIKDFLRAFNGLVADGLDGRGAGPSPETLGVLADRARVHLAGAGAGFAAATDEEMEMLGG